MRSKASLHGNLHSVFTAALNLYTCNEWCTKFESQQLLLSKRHNQSSSSVLLSNDVLHCRC